MSVEPEEIDPWDHATDGPGGTKYLPLPGEGTNGDNCYLVRFPGGFETRAFCKPALGIEAMISEMLDPPPPPPQPVIVPYGAFERRWTDDELAGLFGVRKTTWQVDRYITLASAQGHVNLSGPTAAAAKALFVELGVLTAERADVIFATT
jgi:hypothetical protein